MDVTFFSFSLVSAEEPLTVALLIGIFLVVVGVLLWLLPRSEQRSQRSTPLRHSKAPPPVVPGYRIRSEQAKMPRQFLSVPRIAALDVQRGPQLTSQPNSVATTEALLSIPETIAETQDQPDSLSDEPTLAFPLLPETSQQITEPEIAAGDETDQIMVVPLQESASIPMAAVETTPAEPEAADLPDGEEQSAVEEALLDAAASASSLSEERDELSPDEPSVISTNASAQTQQDALTQPPIRKARLSSVFAEKITERSFTKDAPPLAQPPPLPEPEPPQSAARRAHLTGFPHPAAQTDTAAVTQHSEESAKKQPDVVSSAPAASEEGAIPPLLRVVCFGTVDILVNGKPLSPLDSRFRASREFELMAFLAYSAAMRRQAFVDRSAITEALLSEEIDDDPEDESAEENEESWTNRRSPLGGWKYRLCRRLRSQGIPDHAWLESRADGALRLRPEVQIDLVEFLHISSLLRKARDQIRRSDRKLPKHEEVLEWLQRLRQLYRDRGEFAEQFQLQEWTQEPRRRYRNIYWHALFYGAELLAALEDRPTAIQLAEELVEQEEVETEVVYEALLTWLQEDGNKPDLSRWLTKYREWYSAAHDERSLDVARPDFIARLNLGTLPRSSTKYR